MTSYTATANPGGSTCTGTTPKYGDDWFECFIPNVVNGQTYTVSVVALSSAGTSAPTSFGPVRPLPYVRITVKAKKSASVLFVDVDPNLKGARYWKLKVYKVVGNDLIPKGTYHTQGRKETRTINMKRGTYVVIVQAKYDHLMTRSVPVTLQK